MQNILKAVILLGPVVSCMSLAGYGQVKMVDVSSEPNYFHVIGKKYRLKQDLLALGFSSAYISTLPVDYYTLYTRRIGANRFILSEDKMTKGSVIEVVRVTDSKDWFATRIMRNRYTQYIVKEIGGHRFGPKDLTVKLTGPENDSNYGMDADLYELMLDSGGNGPR